MPCTHQEADRRIFLHLSRAAQQRHSKPFIRTVDSDVVIVAIGHFGSHGLMELWHWNWKSLPAHPRSWSHPNLWTWEVTVASTYPLFYRVWYDVVSPWYREENCQGSMAGIPRPYGNTSRSFSMTLNTWHSTPSRWHTLNAGLLSWSSSVIATSRYSYIFPVKFDRQTSPVIATYLITQFRRGQHEEALTISDYCKIPSWNVFLKDTL